MSLFTISQERYYNNSTNFTGDGSTLEFPLTTAMFDPLPTALGPGGLVTMLQKLRRIRNIERETMKKQAVDTAMDTRDSEKDSTCFEDT